MVDYRIGTKPIRRPRREAFDSATIDCNVVLPFVRWRHVVKSKMDDFVYREGQMVEVKDVSPLDENTGLRVKCRAGELGSVLGLVLD